jgi:competence protein ComEC
MKHKDIYRYVTLDEGRELVNTIPQQGFNLLRWAEQVRDKIEVSLVKAVFEQQHVNVIKALILGQKQDLKRSTYQKFANAGIVYILAVSGLHVGIVLIILQYLFKPLNYIRYGKGIMLILFFLWGFALMAGFSPSVVRASLMLSIFAFATDIFKRTTNTINLLALSMIIILIFYPKMIFQVGFQLSYTAVFGIIMLFQNLFKLYQPKFKLDKLAWSVVCVTISAQLAILPLVLYYFHQFP